MATDKKVMEKVRNRSQGICEYCTTRAAQDPHHIKPQARLKLDYPMGIIHVCRICHSYIEDNIGTKNLLIEQLGTELNTLLEKDWYSINDLHELLDIEISDLEKAVYKHYVKMRFADVIEISKESLVRWLT